TMTLKQIVLPVIVLGLTLLAPTYSVAATIGTFNFGGSDVTLGVSSLDFQCNPALTFAPCPGPVATGNFTVSSSTGDMAAYATEGGYIKDVTLGPTQLNQPFLLSNFITFSGGPIAVPNFQFDLKFIFLGVNPQASCGAPA